MNLRCLIVDDEELGRMLIENYVQRLGFTIVAQCRNPLEAMQIMQTNFENMIRQAVLEGHQQPIHQISNHSDKH